MLVYAIIFTLILTLIGLSLWVSYTRTNLMESFSSRFSAGSGSYDSNDVIQKDYFFQLVPDISIKLILEINDELNSSSKKESEGTASEPMTFSEELNARNDMKQRYMVNGGIPPSTILSLFLGNETNFNIKLDTTFATNEYATTSTGKSREEFVNHIISKYFQNFNLVNALDGYRLGMMPTYSITNASGMIDKDTLVNQASLILQIIRSYKNTHSDKEIDDIPSFSMSRVFQSTQDRLESKCALLFKLITDVDITNVDTWKSSVVDLEDKDYYSEDVKTSVSEKTKALEQTQGYVQPFMVALMRNLLDKTGLTPTTQSLVDTDGLLVYNASRTGVSKTNGTITQYDRIPLPTGYVPNTLKLLGDVEPIAFKNRFRDMMFILLKNLRSPYVSQVTQCLDNSIEEKQHCSKYWESRDDIALTERMVYYLMGIYKDSSSKKVIEQDIKNLKDLAEDNVSDVTFEYVKKGFFTTDELVLLNGLEHRTNFIGPYTSCLRLIISRLPSITGGSNATMREDLMLIADQLKRQT